MSKKRANYTPAFKTKLVLELLQNESTLAEIAM
jgi:transposase-like protein